MDVLIPSCHCIIFAPGSLHVTWGVRRPAGLVWSYIITWAEHGHLARSWPGVA